MAPLRFEFGDGQPPIHAAAGRAVPKRAGPVGEFVQDERRFRRVKHPHRRQVIDQRPARFDPLPEARRRGLDRGMKVNGILPVAPPIRTSSMGLWLAILCFLLS